MTAQPTTPPTPSPINLRREAIERAKASDTSMPAIATELWNTYPEAVQELWDTQGRYLFGRWVNDIVRTYRLEMEKRRPTLAEVKERRDRFLDAFFVVDRDGHGKTLTNMLPRDHDYVADEYEDQESISRSKKLIHRWIARELRRRGGENAKTGDIWTEEELLNIFNQERK